MTHVPFRIYSPTRILKSHPLALFGSRSEFAILYAIRFVRRALLLRLGFEPDTRGMQHPARTTSDRFRRSALGRASQILLRSATEFTEAEIYESEGFAECVYSNEGPRESTIGLRS